MRQFFPIFILLTLAILAGCAEQASLGGNTKGQDEFTYTLGVEYKNLADFEKEIHGRKDIIHAFAEKQKASEHGDTTIPFDPSHRDVPDHAVEELSIARKAFFNAMETKFVPENEKLLAMAQTRYDCWLMYQEQYKGKGHNFPCREDFYNVMAVLRATDHPVARVPKSREIPGKIEKYVIYFNSNSTSLSKDAFRIVNGAAIKFQKETDAIILLNGLTDTRGNQNDNKMLALRRAVAVKNALGQYGVDLDKVVINPLGEAGVKNAVDETATDSRSRRVEIIFRHEKSIGRVYRDVTDAPGWTHIGGDI